MFWDTLAGRRSESGERISVDLNTGAFACFGRWTRSDELF
jgi:hypothetical protein